MKCILFAGIVATFFVFGETLKCYHTIGINRPFNSNDPSITCLGKSSRCIKSTFALLNGTTLDLRTCIGNFSVAPPEFLNIILNFPMNEATIALNFQSFCDSDNCNGAQSIIAVFSIILAGLFITIFASH